MAHWGKYHAQFNFSGRLKRVTEINTTTELRGWLQQNPQGRIMSYAAQASTAAVRPEFERQFRGGYLQVWSASQFYAAQPQAAPPPP